VAHLLNFRERWSGASTGGSTANEGVETEVVSFGARGAAQAPVERPLGDPERAKLGGLTAAIKQ
jgi:hypothetical protein